MTHGWVSTTERLADVERLIARECPDADRLLIDHEGANFFCNVSPVVIADRIASEIEYRVADKAESGARYRSITLIGHSTGALLLKKAYAFAQGLNEDSIAREAYTWSAIVDRFICLAGVDRGLAFAEKNENMSLARFVIWRVAYGAARFFRTASYIRAFERGSPFIVNLRLQWIRMIYSKKLTAAPVYQLVGDRDDLVARCDSVDELLRSSCYVYKAVIGADHETIALPSESKYVRRALVSALTESPNRKNDYDRSEVTDVFYVVHGIRDLGQRWTPRISAAIIQTLQRERPKRVARTVHTSYGYFSMLSFLLSWDRQRNVRWFMDLYSRMVAQHPKAHHHYVGHSNGTYILASALERYETCKVKHVVFAGSVVRSSYNWTKIFTERRVAYVRNDVANADWVVGIFPHLFELLAAILSNLDLNAPKWLDLGGAGFNGFYDDAVTCNYYLVGSHEAALTDDNIESIASSAVYGSDCQPGGKMCQAQNSAVARMSKFAWLTLPIAGAVIMCEIIAWRRTLRGAAVTLATLAVMYTV